MKEQLVSFETAVLAKEKGFDWKVLTVFAKEDGKYGLKPYKKGDVIILHTAESFIGIDTYTEMLNNEGYSNNTKAVSCPTQALLQKWLRNVHNIQINIYPRIKIIELEIEHFNHSYIISGFTKTHNDILIRQNDNPSNQTYEDTLEEALVEALNTINTK